MSKVLLILLLCLNFAVADDSADQNESNIINVTQQIQAINAQIQILKSQVDENSTDSASNLYKLNDRKSKLLSQIPFSVMQIDVKQSDLDKFEAQKLKVEKNVEKYGKSGNKNLYVKNAVELEKMKIAQTYYGTMIKLEELFKNGAKNSQIQELVEDGLLNLQTSSYVAIKDLKSTLEGGNLDEYNAALAELDLQKQTSEEILNYLKRNAALLSSTLFVSELNLKTTIDYINDKIGVNPQKFNVGKIVISFLVFAFFVSLTRILVKISYWLFLSFFTKNIHAEAIKEQVLMIIERPISALLIIYALNMCAGIWYYPVPMPIKFANFFAIVYTVAFGWLVLTLLNGYGLLLIGEIAKKSGRKEVVNLVLKIIYFIVIIITLLMVLSRLGFDISAFVASLGIGGLAVAFAAKDIIANFFASVMLLFDNSFSQGDQIVCGDIEGTVVEIGLRKTTIRTSDNALIFVPNSKLASDPIRNWSRRKMGRQIRIVVGVEYGATAQQLQKCIDDIKQMLTSHPGIATSEDMGSKKLASRYRQNIVSLDDLAGYKSNLFVVLDELADSSINILIYCFSKTIVLGEFLEIKQDIILKVMKIVEDNGLGFAFPSQSLYIQNLQSAKDALKDKL